MDYRRRLVGDREAEELRARGYRAADLHVHSIFSPDVIAPGTHPLDLVRRARARGLRYLSITDHDSVDAYRHVLGWDTPGVVPGAEIEVRDPSFGAVVHVNVYELDEGRFGELMEIAHGRRDLEAFAAYCREQGLPCAYNHPFWSPMGVPSPDVAAAGRIMRLFPVTELNMGRVREKNHAAARLGSALGRGLLANTDTHVADVGRACTLARGETFREFFESVRAGRAYLKARDLSNQDLIAQVKTVIQSAFTYDRPEVAGIPLLGAKGRFSGIGVLDRLAVTILRGRLNPRPRLKELFRRALLGLADLRLLPSIYLAAEARKGRRVAAETAPLTT